MHINVTGHGHDVVLLHGWGMHSGVWNEIAALLALQFRVHNVDLPGYGGSPACSPYTLDAIVTALAAGCPARTTVCGWSLGGLIAMRWALAHPAQVERLVLVASTPCFIRVPDWESAMAPAVFDAFAQEFGFDPRGTSRRFALLQAEGDKAARRVSRRLRDCVAGDESDAATLAAGLRILRESDLRGDLPDIIQPTLILHGECDAVVPVAAGRYLRKYLAHSSLEIIAGAAHAPFITQPQKTARRIAEGCHG